MPILLSIIIYISSFFPGTIEDMDTVDDISKIDQISFIIKDGSSKALSKYFDNNIELNINGNLGQYSKAQAELVIREFFNKYPPLDFEIIHQSGHLAQILYLIGNYSSEEFHFRVLIKSKSDEEDLKIYSMDIIRV